LYVLVIVLVDHFSNKVLDKLGNGCQ